MFSALQFLRVRSQEGEVETCWDRCPLTDMPTRLIEHEQDLFVGPDVDRGVRISGVEG